MDKYSVGLFLNNRYNTYYVEGQDLADCVTQNRDYTGLGQCIVQQSQQYGPLYMSQNGSQNQNLNFAVGAMRRYRSS